MNRKDLVVILGTAHLDHPWIPGKCSPDGSFKEAIFSRELIDDLISILNAYNFFTLVDYPWLVPDGKNIKPYNNAKEQQRAELSYRVKFVNDIVKTYGRDKVIYVPLHVNASGNGKEWMKARGWEIYTSPGVTRSDILAEEMFRAAEHYLPKECGVSLRSDLSDGDHDKEYGYYVLTQTNCPAVLVENLFMDNKEDLEILKSEKGKLCLGRVIVEGILNYWEKRN